MAFGLGAGTVEQVKHLTAGEAGPLCGLMRLPVLSTLRPRLAALADRCDPLALQRGEVAVACGLSGRQLTDPRAGHGSLPDLVWRQLDQASGWLLVIDNVDDPAALSPSGDLLRDYRGWVRPGSRGLLVVTSRDRNHDTWGDRAVLVRAAPLDDQSGGRILSDLAPEGGDSHAAGMLAARLGGLPLALYAAGVYLARPTAAVRTFDGYRQRLTDRFGELLGADDPNAGEPAVARRLVRYTWELSLDQLAHEGHRHARAVLGLLAVFADAPVPRSLITDTLVSDATGQPATAAAVDGALAGLHRYGLVETPALDSTGSIPTLALHTIVRDAAAYVLTRDHSNAARYGTAINNRLLHAAREATQAGRAGWQTARLLAPHLHLTLIPTPGPEAFPAVKKIFDGISDLLQPAGHYAELIRLHQAFLTAEEQLLGPDHPDALAGRHNLAVALNEIARHREAADMHRSVLDGRTKLFGQNLDALRSRNSLADALTKQGRPHEATQLLDDVLDTYIQILGSDHPDVLASRHTLAFALAVAGRYNEAITLLGPIIDGRTVVLGSDHPDTLRSRNALGFTLAGLGRYTEVVDLYRRLLDDRTKVLGPDHPDIFGCRNNLGWRSTS